MKTGTGKNIGFPEHCAVYILPKITCIKAAQASEQHSAEEQKQTQLSYMSLQASGAPLQHSAQLDHMTKTRPKLDFKNPWNWRIIHAVSDYKKRWSEMSIGVS